MKAFITGWLTTSVDYARMVNTYEITYGALASIFHINPVYFCKVSWLFITIQCLH